MRFFRFHCSGALKQCPFDFSGSPLNKFDLQEKDLIADKWSWSQSSEVSTVLSPSLEVPTNFHKHYIFTKKILYTIRSILPHFSCS